MPAFGRFPVLALALMLSAPAVASVDISDALIAVTDLGLGNYGFTQGGWTAGGLVTGSFTGSDDNFDGQLNSFDGEISQFSMSFSGNANVKPFSLGLSDLFGLVYDLNHNVLGDGVLGTDEEGILVIGPRTIYDAGPGLITICGIGDPCALIANVPEPATWALLIAGFGLTGAVLRRRGGLRGAYTPERLLR